MRSVQRGTVCLATNRPVESGHSEGRCAVPTLYSRFHIKNGPDRAAAAGIALDLCRASRARKGCLNARYYWANINEIVMLSDWETGVDVLAPPASGLDPAVGELTYKLHDIADRTAWELWTDARAGKDAYVRTGRA